MRPSHRSLAARTPPFQRVKVVRRIGSWNPDTRKTTLTASQTKTVPASRRVTFSNNHDIRGVIRREDMTEDDFASIWYCKEDFKAMKRDYMPTLKKMAKELPLEFDEESRGLEHKTPKGSKRRHKNRLVSIDAVLREQDRQWERKLGDQGFIAELYIQATAHCRLEASIKAKEDEEYIRKHVEEESFQDVIDECGESALSLGWSLNEESYVESPEERDKSIVCDGESLETSTFQERGEQSCIEVKRVSACMILAVA